MRWFPRRRDEAAGPVPRPGRVGPGSAGAGSAGAGSVGPGSVGAGSVGAGSVGAGSPASEPGGQARRSTPALVGIGVIAALLVAGVVGDHLIGAGAPPQAAAADTGPAIPTVAGPGTLSSTWFCPALQATSRSAAKGRIIIANPTAGVLSGTVTVIPSTGTPVVESPVIQPYDRLTYRLEALAPGPFAAATVSLDEPGGAVEQEVQGPLGQSITPCATSSSDHWYFAAGRADDADTELLSLYNPYPAAAIADLSFATETGPAIPDAFQGIVVPAGGFNVIDVGARVRLRTAVAATVDVRSGRLVVDKLEVQSGTAGSAPHGLALTLGATAPATRWYYADGVSGPGLREHFEIYNPGNQEADIQLAPVLDQGSAEPFPLTVPPFDRVSLEVDKQQRIPPGVGQAWVLTSTNDVPVVAERVIEAGPPGPHTGVGDTFGTPRPATGWVFPAGSAGPGADEWLVLFNPSDAPARVSLTASGLGQPQPLPVVALAAGSRRAIEISTELPKGIVVLEVTSTVPIVAERAQFVLGGPGMSDSTGILAATPPEVGHG
jgi:hypothetical protein